MKELIRGQVGPDVSEVLGINPIDPEFSPGQKVYFYEPVNDMQVTCVVKKVLYDRERADDDFVTEDPDASYSLVMLDGDPDLTKMRVQRDIPPYMLKRFEDGAFTPEEKSAVNKASIQEYDAFIKEHEDARAKRDAERSGVAPA